MQNRLPVKSAKKAIGIAFILLAGCASVATDRSSVMSDAMGPDDSTVNSNQSQRMIVATITNETHTKITGGVPINMVSADGQEFPPPNYLQFLNELKNQYGVKTVADWPLDSLGVRCFIFEIQEASERDVVIKKLRLDQRIETAQPMQEFSTLGENYNDPYLKLQHNYKTLDVDKSHHWATGKGVIISVIDTGTDFNHEDLKSQISARKNFVDKDNRAFRQDKHGTAISGVIAASTNNATGMAGIAPDAKIFPMKACWQTSINSDKAQCSSFTLAKAINFAIGQTVDIINLSLAGPNDPLIERLINRALKKHITVVAAVGPHKDQNFPATMPGVLAVKQLGSTMELSKQQYLHAPGKQILATTPDNQYDFFSGSSFSTAQVSGLIALIKERKPHLSNENIYSALKSSEPLFRKIQKQNTSVNACTTLAKIIGSVCK